MIDKLQYDLLAKTITTRGGRAIFMGDQKPSATTGYTTLDAAARSLGFTASIDVDYNGLAKINHDLNFPVPSNLLNSAMLVYDGGTCEHVANVGKAFCSMALMCRVGGLVLQESPIYPYGQAYWGVSPEIQREFFRQNGFELVSQVCYYRSSFRMWLLHVICRTVPKGPLEKLRNRVKRVGGVKEALFVDNPRHVKVYEENVYLDKEAYKMHWQTRTLYLGRKMSEGPLIWPTMGCYPSTLPVQIEK